jgi:cytochrome c biogenesis protein ResB
MYEGTDVARSIWSRVRIQNPVTDEDIEAVIAVNKPFRYRGETYYQSQMDSEGQASTLHLVRNPAWPLPYVSAALMALGLLLQLATRTPRIAPKGTA